MSTNIKTTVALQNLQLFAWVDRFTRNAVLVWLASLIAVATLLALTGGLDAERSTLWLLLLPISIAFWFFTGTGAQADVQTLIDNRLADNRDLERLAPTPRAGRLETGAGMVFGLAFFVLDGTRRGLSPTESLAGIATAPFWLDAGRLYWLDLVFALLWMSVAVHQIMFFYRQQLAFRRIARVTVIDLLNIDQYTPFANPLFRMLAVFAVAAAVALTTGDGTAAHYRLVAQVGAVVMLALGVTAVPIIAIRNRIRFEKRREIHNVRRAIDGHREALETTRIHEQAHEFTTPDLMYYEDRISSVWEWPLHNQVSRLVFYLVVPPLAWLMAALVEMGLDAALQ